MYRRGLISFNEPVANPASVQIDDTDQLLLFPFRWNTEAVAINYTTVRAFVHNYLRTGSFDVSPQMRVVLTFLYYGTTFRLDGAFVPRFLVIVEWRNLTFSCCPDQVHSFPYPPHTHIQACTVQASTAVAKPIVADFGLFIHLCFSVPQAVDFQVVLIGNRQTTYVIYTYFCPSGPSPYDAGFVPHPISATVGVSIEDLFDREFRYSNTDYTVEMRCINRIAESNIDYNWYNLYYNLTDNSMDISLGEFLYVCK